MIRSVDMTRLPKVTYRYVTTMVTSQTQSHSVPPPHDTLCGHDSTSKGYLQIRHYHGDVSNSISLCPTAPWYALWTWLDFQRLPTDTSLPWWRLKLNLTLSHRPMIRSVDMTRLPKVTYRYVTTMVTSQTQSHSVPPLCGHGPTSKGYLQIRHYHGDVSNSISLCPTAPWYALWTWLDFQRLPTDTSLPWWRLKLNLTLSHRPMIRSVDMARLPEVTYSYVTTMVTSQTQSHSVPPPHDTLCGHDPTSKGYLQIRHYHGDVSNSISLCPTAPWYALWTWPHFQRLPTDTSLPWWRLKLSLTLSHRPMIRSVDMAPLPKVTYRYVTTIVTSQTLSHSVPPPHDTLCGHDPTSRGHLQLRHYHGDVSNSVSLCPTAPW